LKRMKKATHDCIFRKRDGKALKARKKLMG